METIHTMSKTPLKKLENTIEAAFKLKQQTDSEAMFEQANDALLYFQRQHKSRTGMYHRCKSRELPWEPPDGSQWDDYD